MTFQALYDASTVKRWHTCLTIKEQDLAAHQWGVAMVIREIAPGHLHMLEYALTHDLGESVSGDTPYLGKSKYPAIKDAIDLAEFEFAMERKLPMFETFNTLEKQILRWADMFEAYLFALREVAMGNQHMQSVVDNALRALSRIGHPNERAIQLLKETHV